MENQFQSLVFEDGEWVTRSRDVYQAMAQNQHQEDTTMQEPDSNLPQEAPVLGILSRTVIETPFSRFILPANIRHKDLNDVVLIGEDSVQLKEICDYGHLRHVTTKSDFKGKIIAARVFGDPRMVQVSSFEQSLLLSRATVHGARRSTTGEEEYTLPPEVVLLTLSSRTLMFLWASDNQTGPVIFRQRTVRLPPGTSRFDQLGRHLAVDPRGRAIAVAAYEDRFILYKTKSQESWRKESRAGHEGLPIVDEAIIPIEGRIMHMEFLSSGGMRDDAHVVLIFVLVHEGKTKVACYDWDFGNSMDESTARKERSHVDFDDRTPSLLIPLSQTPDFLLVSDEHISLYNRVLSGPPECTQKRIPAHFLPSLRPGNSKSLPRWVQWGRATRNPGFDKEVFYVAREDGAVIYVERGSSNAVEITRAGSWPYPIDTAFACLTINNSRLSQAYPDILVSGGAGSDGVLCKVGAWPTEYAYKRPFSQSNSFSFAESVPSWAPLADMTVSKLPGIRKPYERERAGVFVTSGKAPDGEISELRRGLKAVIDDSFGGMEGCTGLWIIDHGVQTLEYDGYESQKHYATFIFTIPPETIVIRATRIQAEGSSSENEPWRSWHSGIWAKTQLSNKEGLAQDDIIRTEETIAACCWRDYAVQVTRKEARILRRPNFVGAGAYSFPSLLLGAAAKTDVPLVVVSYRHGDKAILELIPLLDDGTLGTTRNNPERDLPCDPTCIELMKFHDAILVFVGTVDASICLFKVGENGSLARLYDTRLAQEPATGLRMVCESAVLLKSREQQQLELVCGTRDGFLVSLILKATENGYELVSKSITKMGSTAVQVSSSATDPSTAFVACGSDFCRMRCSTTTSHTANIDSIWLVDRPTSAYIQGPIAALDQIPPATGPGHGGKDLGGFIFAIAGEQMVFAQLDYDVRWSSHDFPPASLEQSKVVPRKLRTGATPTKLIYAEGNLQNVVVATTENSEERKPPNGYRALRSSLKFLRPHDEQPNDEAEIKQEDGQKPRANRIVTWEYPLQPYERVLSMMEWTYERGGGKKHHFIVIGTGVTTGQGQETGRRLFFNTGKPGSGVKLTKALLHDHPVRCMAVFDNTHLISIVGTTLRIHEFKTDGRWPVRAGIQLPSMGVHMTVSGSFIHVSTSHDSHICYEVYPTGQDGDLCITQIFTDSRQRSLAHHLVYDIEGRESDANTSASVSALPSNSTPQASSTTHTDTLIFLTDKTCSVTGLFHQSTPTIKSATTTLFEAHLPRSIIRIHRADIRPPWRRPCTDPAKPFEGITGIMADDIIGACTDGTIYSFSLLTESARRLLRLLQNIIEAKQKRDPELQHTPVRQRSSDIFSILQNGASGEQTERIRARDVDPERQEVGPASTKFNHVDGDLLARWMENDGNVRNLVEVGCEPDVGALLMNKVNELAMNNGKEAEDLRGSEHGWVEHWLGVVLIPLL